MFKTPKWDTDASSENIYSQLFENKSKNGKIHKKKKKSIQTNRKNKLYQIKEKWNKHISVSQSSKSKKKKGKKNENNAGSGEMKNIRSTELDSKIPSMGKKFPTFNSEMKVLKSENPESYLGIQKKRKRSLSATSDMSSSQFKMKKKKVSLQNSPSTQSNIGEQPTESGIKGRKRWRKRNKKHMKFPNNIETENLSQKMHDEPKLESKNKIKQISSALSNVSSSKSKVKKNKKKKLLSQVFRNTETENLSQTIHDKPHLHPKYKIKQPSSALSNIRSSENKVKKNKKQKMLSQVLPKTEAKIPSQRTHEAPHLELQKKIKKLSAVISNVNSSAKKVKKRKKKKLTQNCPLLSQSSTIQKSTDDENSKKENKKKKRKNAETESTAQNSQENLDNSTVKSPFNINKLKQMLESSMLKGEQKRDNIPQKKQTKDAETLRDRMLKRLQASRFRYINEQLYTSGGKDAKEYFHAEPEAFQAYHEGYQQQVKQWPINPLDIIIKALKKMSSELVVADFGCGDARLARSVPNLVHSFDLVAVSEEVTACNMAHTPLSNTSVDVAVFCLSLMGTNLNEYISEANRVLKEGGLLKIAEVESRIENIEMFIQQLQKYGFVNTWKDLSHNLFYFMDFKKERCIGKKMKKKLPELTLKPCLYKKR